VKEKSQNS